MTSQPPTHRAEKIRAEKIREAVATAYNTAITGRSSGCCSRSRPASSCSTNSSTEYGEADLRGLPASATSCSFGSGNPLASSEVKGGDTVLDLGSGAGLDLLIAGRKVGPSGHVIGVDMTDEMIAAARRNIEDTGMEHVEVRKGLIEDLPVDSASVDWVISNCVVNLSPEKDRVFAEIARVLRPGGRMLIGDIVVEDLPGWMRDDDVLVSACVAGAISEAQYVEGLRQAGLEEVQTRDRVAVSTSEIEAFIQSGELSTRGEGDTPSGDRAGQITRALAGKVWRAKFYARKPEAPGKGHSC